MKDLTGLNYLSKQNQLQASPDLWISTKEKNLSINVTHNIMVMGAGSYTLRDDPLVGIPLIIVLVIILMMILRFVMPIG